MQVVATLAWPADWQDEKLVDSPFIVFKESAWVQQLVAVMSRYLSSSFTP